LDESTKLKILLSIFTGNKTYSDIREDKGLSPKTLQECMPYLAKEGLIEIDDKGWKRGKSKSCQITETGIDWLIKTSVLDSLKVFSSILNGLKKPENRNIYQKISKKKYSQSITLVRNYLIECAQKGLKPFEELRSLTEWEHNKKFRIMDLDQILRDALKKMYMLIVFYLSDKSWEEIEGMINSHYHVFGPRMEHWFSYRLGSNANIDSHFLQISKEFKRAESNQENLERESQRMKENKENFALKK